MLNVRRLSLFDKCKVKEIVQSNGYGNDLKYPILKEIFCNAQSFLPLRFKFLPETFVCTDGNELTGLISVRAVRGNPYVINILQLIFANNDYNTGKELINFVVEYYGRQGAKTFKVMIDDGQKDLENLFMNSCGFRCGSWENLWDLSDDIEHFIGTQTINFVQMNDGFSSDVADLINSELQPYYKPALERTPDEFRSPVIEVFNNFHENSFIKHLNRKVCAYLTIKTPDNENYILTPYKNSGYNIAYDEIISFGIKNILAHRSSKFKLYLCQKKNLKFATELEDYLNSHDYKCINTKHLLIKEFYKPVKQEYKSFVFGENALLTNR